MVKLDSPCRRRPYASFEAAMEAAKRGSLKAQTRLRPYRCPDCGALHVAAVDQAIARNAQARAR